MERPIFIVGCARSGTTLLRDLLRHHPRLAFAPESQVLPQWWQVHGDPATDAEALRLASDLLASSSISSWGLATRPQDVAHHRTFAGVAGALFEEWARREGKPRWGEKTPMYARHMPLLARLWPGAQFVHIIRDGRDVTCSWMEKGWLAGAPHRIGSIWADVVTIARRDGAELGADRYLEVRYEDLVAEPEPTLRAICAHLGEEFTPKLLTPARRTSDSWGAHDKAPYVHAIRDTSVGRWRSELTSDQQALVASAAGDLIEELGYPPAGPRRAPTRRELMLLHARSRASYLRFRLTAPERVPLARQTLVTWRARLRARLTR